MIKLEWATRYDPSNNAVVGFWQAATPNYEFTSEGDSPLEAAMNLLIILSTEMGMVG